tara:strand:- start:3186 stop:3416 length:231 start_codon:yes stop_codon:yes gene_type:complete
MTNPTIVEIPKEDFVWLASRKDLVFNFDTLDVYGPDGLYATADECADGTFMYFATADGRDRLFAAYTYTPRNRRWN